MRIVSKKDIDTFFDLISKSRIRLGELKMQSSHEEISTKVTALSDENKALANGSIALIKLRSEYKQILMRIQKQIVLCTGIKPRKDESPDQLLDRLTAMSQAEIVTAIKSNGLVWES